MNNDVARMWEEVDISKLQAFTEKLIHVSELIFEPEIPSE
jgi:hypothetical protein